MEHIFILKGLDCPNCSAKIEKEVGELAGVQLSSMNLMKQTLTVQAEASVTNLLDTVTTIKRLSLMAAGNLYPVRIFVRHIFLSRSLRFAPMQQLFGGDK